MLENLKEKCKSWPLWVAVAALVTFCVKEFTGVDINNTVDGLLNVLLPVLIGFGVVNNPNDKSHI